MIYLKVFENNSYKENIVVSDFVFNRQFNKVLVFQVVLVFLSYEKMCFKAQKTRAQVRGGGRKPWKQKGTGRARAGTIRSPLWRGGGRIFAAYKVSLVKKKINKKMYKLAILCILSEFVRNDCLFIIESFFLEKPNVNFLLDKIKFCFENNKKYLLLVPKGTDVNIKKSVRNVFNLNVKYVRNFTIIDLVKCNCIILFRESVDELCEVFLK